ncbi:hypothetical protein G6F57_017885 [Rhizopus arrhizus]|nr:hypothetical protein G6F57_017885 [Rhizopus arrhizus]
MSLGVDRRFPGRHHAVTALGDGLHDGFRRTAIQPVAIGQVRKAGAALRVRAVALRARIQEQALAHFQGGRILRHLRHGHGLEARVDRAHGLGHLGLVARDFFRAAVAQLALVRTQAGHEEQVAQREHARQQVHPGPPRGDRVVELGQGAVPDVAGVFDLAGGRLVGEPTALRVQQPHAPDHAAHGDDRDEIPPEAINEIAHDRFAPSCCAWPNSSGRANGSMADSRLALWRPREQAPQTMPK